MRNAPEDRDRWTDERKKIVTTMWNEGQSSTHIASVFGVSRSSILGLVHRLGLSNRRVATPRAARKPKPPTKFNFATNATKSRPAKDDEPYVYRETIVTPEDQRIAFEALKEFDKRCRYPHGDELPFMYCGAKVVPGQPWCPTHFKACAPAMAAKHEAAQLSGNSGQLEQPGNPREFEQLQNLQQLEGVA